MRGKKVINIEGNKYERIVISVFDSTEKAQNCYKSKEYQYALSFLNDDIVDRIIHIAEGID